MSRHTSLYTFEWRQSGERWRIAETATSAEQLRRHRRSYNEKLGGKPGYEWRIRRWVRP